MKLYTVTVEAEFVFASESDDVNTVREEFERALRYEPGMRGEVMLPFGRGYGLANIVEILAATGDPPSRNERGLQRLRELAARAGPLPTSMLAVGKPPKETP